MKTAKYILLGAMMTVISAPSMAQDAVNVVPQATEIIKSKAADADKQVNGLYKQVKKDAKQVAGIGRAYLGIKDFTNAEKYADLAIKANKKAAAGYVLKGDICVLQDDGGQASSWFEQAIYFDPQDPEGYRRYAQINSKSDPAGSIAKLEQLRSVDPNYPVDIVAAEIESRANHTDAAINYYSKARMNQMENYQLTDYSMLLFLKQDYNKSLEVAKYGTNKFPRYASLNRLVMLNDVNLKNYDEAAVYGDKLFNASDSAKYSYVDYANYGTALQNLKRNDEAIAVFNKILDDPNIKQEDKVASYKNLSDVYKSMGDINKAIEYYKLFLEKTDKPSANQKYGLAQIYKSIINAENATPEQKKMAYDEFDPICTQIADEFPDFSQYVTYQRAKMANKLDPELKQGLAKPAYDKIIEIVTGNTDNISDDQKAENNKQLLEAYQYNMVYALQIKNDTPTSKSYAAKILEIDPENAMAKQVNTLK